MEKDKKGRRVPVAQRSGNFGEKTSVTMVFCCSMLHWAIFLGLQLTGIQLVGHQSMTLYSQKHEYRKLINLEFDMSAKRLAIFLAEIAMSSMLLRRYHNLEVGMSMGKESSFEE